MEVVAVVGWPTVATTTKTAAAGGACRRRGGRLPEEAVAVAPVEEHGRG